MSAGGITTAQMGTAIPLAYGFVRATGQRIINHTDASGIQYGIWILGEGEWDGPDAFFMNNVLQFLWGGAGTLVGTGIPNILTLLHFHPGIDTPPGTSMVAGSLGGDQAVDDIFNALPDIVNKLTYSRLAYYAASLSPSGSNSNSQMQPVGDWRAMKCRMFDASGTQTGYGFTTNPTWHWVDSWLRIAIKPEYAITAGGGADFLTAAEKSFFKWDAIYEHAQYNDAVLANGSKRFEGSYAFPSQTTLAAIHEQMLLSCRSFQRREAGKLAIYSDKARSSIFVMSGQHLIPQTLTVDEKQVHQNASRYTGKFLDLNLPAVAAVSSSVLSANLADNFFCDAVMTIVGNNPIANGDIFFLGGSGIPTRTADGFYVVKAVNGATVHATSVIPDSTISYPIGTVTGGEIGYPQTRFSPRAPQIPHKQDTLAQGQIMSAAAGNLSRKKIDLILDFANCSFDQQNRLLKYELYRDLGLDQTPWTPPVTINLKAWSEAVDASWNILKSARCGDVITLDFSVSWEYQGDYEIIEQKLHPFQGDASQPGGEAIVSPDQNSGTLELMLRTYNPNVFFDVSDAPDAAYATVPRDTLWGGKGPVNSTYQVIADTLVATYVSGGGGSATIAWSGVQVRLGGTDVVLSYDDGTATGEPTGTTLFAYVDDPFARGGAIPLIFTDHNGVLTAAVGRMYIDSITTPSAPGTTGGGGGGGGGGIPCFNGVVEVRLECGLIVFAKMPKRVRIVGFDGRVRWAKLLVHEYDGDLIQLDPQRPKWGVVPAHMMKDGREWPSAELLYKDRPRFHFKGSVYNLSIEKPESFDLASYVLGNGAIAHNAKRI